jgi:hypothetical protein
MKKLLIILALCGLTMQITSCKAKNTQDDAELVDNADVAKIEAEDDFAATMDTSSSSDAVTDESLQAALGETPNESTPLPEVTASTDELSAPDAGQDIAAAPQLDELTLADSNTADPGIGNVTTDPAMAEATGITETPIVETPIVEAPVENYAAADTSVFTPEPADVAPVAKIESTPPVAPKSSLKKLTEIVPYQEGDGWVNTVYIAHPKETLKQISQKIYSSDRSKELKAINTSFKSRGPRSGERVFYVSPNRPMDSSKTITFYEDTGMIPETYVAQKGDNLKRISKKLLGYEGAWKEVWITNPVESQGKLAEGEVIRYYKPATATPAPEVIANNNPPPPMPDQNSMPQMAPPPMPELPPPTMANNEMPMPQEAPPPPPDMNMQADMNPPPPPEMPPPPPADFSPPPPMETAMAPQPAPPPMGEDAALEEGGEGLLFGLDQTQLALAAIVLIGLVAMIMMRARKKKKEAELAAMSETNVI